MRFFITIFLFCIWHNLTSQELIDAKKMQIEDGLADRIIFHVERDSYGYFYLITENNIQRFDGKNFENVDMSGLSDMKVKTSEISDFVKGEDGNLYILIKNSQAIAYIKPASLVLTKMHNNAQGSIFIYNNKLWTAFREDSLYRLSVVGQDIPMIQLNRLPENIIETSCGYYVGYRDSIRYVSEYIDEKLTCTGRIVAADTLLYVLSDSAIYMCQYNDCKPIFRLSKNSMQLRLVQKEKTNKLMVGYGIIPRFIDTFLIVDHNAIHRIDTIPALDHVFMDCYADNAYHKVMTVGYTGMHIFNFLKEGARFVRRREPGKEMFGFIVSGVAVGKDDKIVFLNEGAGIHTIDKPHQDAEKILDKYRSGQGYIRNGKMVYNASDDKYYSNGYYHENKSDIYALDAKSFTPSYATVFFKVSGICPLGDQKVALAGYKKNEAGNQGVIGYYDFSDKIFYQKYTYPYSAYEIYYDKKTKTYWIGTKQGLLVFDINFNLISQFDRYQTSNAQNLEEDFIVAIKRIGEHIFVGSIGGGLYIIDTDHMHVIKNINKHNGLCDNKVVAFEEDKLGNRWIATFNGLTVLDSKNEVRRVYYEQDGLPNKEFNSGASARDSNGFLYFGTVNGLYVFDPMKVLSWPVSHGIHYNNISLFDDDQHLKIDRLGMKNTSDSVHLDLIFPDYYEYPFGKYNVLVNNNAYCVTHLDSEQQKISLTQFSTGKEDLCISNEYNEYQLHMPLKVSFDYRYILFQLGAILLIGLVFLAINGYLKQKAFKQIEINRRIAGLELTALQSQMNPHFIFNALGAIQYFIQTNDADRADDYLSNFAQLMRMILESSKTKFITIENEVKLLSLYIGLEKIRFVDKFDVDIFCDERIHLDFQLPPMIIQPFIENAINHGVLHLQNKKGLISIDVQYVDEEEIRVILVDNGIGREKSAGMSNKNHRSRGMQIVNERIETFNKDGNFEVSASIVDLKDPDLNPLGTKVVLSFKDYRR